MTNTKHNKIYIVILLKLLIELVITYLIIAKGDAGKFIHDIGFFLYLGNAVFGFFVLAVLTIFNIGIGISTILISNKTPKKLLLSVTAFDVLLILINLFGGIIISGNLGLHYDDAVSKFILWACGAGFVYILLSITLLIFVAVTNKK